MRKELMMLAFLAFIPLSGAVSAACSSAASANGGCAGSLHCVEPISRAHCSDPYCFNAGQKSLITQAECCYQFGNIGAYKFDDERNDTEMQSAENDRFNDGFVYTRSVYQSGDYKGENN